MPPADYAALVEPRLGTTQTRWIAFSSACRPFGMVNVNPDTRTQGDWNCGYHFGDARTVGISHIHEWQIGALRFMPVARAIEPTEDVSELSSAFSHDTEVCKPGDHRIHLADVSIDVELTATHRVALHRYTFPEATPRSLVIDLFSQLGPCEMGEGSLRRLDAHRLEGHLTNFPTIRRPKPLVIYFAVQVSAACTLRVCDASGNVSEIGAAGTGVRGVLQIEGDGAVVFKVGFSYTSVSAAWDNLRAETGDRSFDDLREEARSEWNALLGRIDVDEATADPVRRARFYTDLYFALLGRRTVSDHAGTYIDNTGPSPIVRQIPLDAEGRPRYRHFNSDSFWGAQWTIVPLWSLVWPEVLREFCQCFFDMYLNGRLIPRGPSGGNDTFVMTSAQTTPLFVYGILTGIYKPDDIEAVYAGLKKNHLPGGLMSKAGYEHATSIGGGLDDYLTLGYIPEDLPKVAMHTNGASQTLEHAFNDSCLARLAMHLGKAGDAATFSARAQNFRHLFDRSVGFMRPRNRDGTWVEPYSPWDRRGWTEANGWNFTFYVPHDVPGLIECFGSAEKFLATLERAFAMTEEVGFYVPHESHEKIPLDFGNEPALFTPWLFQLAGKPDRTNHWIRALHRALKSGNAPTDGFGGDEDQGMMGAWNVLVALGLFSVDICSPREQNFLITAPFFEKVRLQAGGSTLLIRATKESSRDGTLSRVEIDGAECPLRQVSYQQLTSGNLTIASYH